MFFFSIRVLSVAIINANQDRSKRVVENHCEDSGFISDLDDSNIDHSNAVGIQKTSIGKDITDTPEGDFRINSQADGSGTLQNDHNQSPHHGTAIMSQNQPIQPAASVRQFIEEIGPLQFETNQDRSADRRDTDTENADTLDHGQLPINEQNQSRDLEEIRDDGNIDVPGGHNINLEIGNQENENGEGPQDEDAPFWDHLPRHPEVIPRILTNVELLEEVQYNGKAYVSIW